MSWIQSQEDEALFIDALNRGLPACAATRSKLICVGKGLADYLLTFTHIKSTLRLYPLFE